MAGGIRVSGRNRLVAVCLAAFAVGLSAPASAAASSADRAATHAYVLAYYELLRAILAQQPAQVAEVAALGNTIAGECRGILGHAPGQPAEQFQNEPRQLTARERGERSLHSEQLGELRQELFQALSPRETEPDQRALAAFLATSGQLRWSSLRITQGVADFVELLRLGSSAQRPAPHVCADMAAWVASGYRRLPPSTKAGALAEPGPPPPLTALRNAIAPDSARLLLYEGPKESHLLAQIRQLRRQSTRGSAVVFATIGSVEAALGIEHGEKRARLGSPQAPPKGSVVLAHGRTSAGERFVARYEPPGGSERTCSLTISNEGERLPRAK